MSRRRKTNFVRDGKRPTWDLIRRYVLSQQPTCAICETAPSVEVDHIWPKFYGGDDRNDNLQGVCVSCNRAKGNTVDPAAATTRELDLATDTILMRMLHAIDDLDRFLIPAMNAAAKADNGETLGTLRMIRTQLAIISGETSKRSDLADEVIEQLETSETAVAYAMDKLFGGIFT